MGTLCFLFESFEGFSHFILSTQLVTDTDVHPYHYLHNQTFETPFPQCNQIVVFQIGFETGQVTAEASIASWT